MSCPIEVRFAFVRHIDEENVLTWIPVLIERGFRLYCLAIDHDEIRIGNRNYGVDAIICPQSGTEVESSEESWRTGISNIKDDNAVAAIAQVGTITTNVCWAVKVKRLTLGCLVGRILLREGPSGYFYWLSRIGDVHDNEEVIPLGIGRRELRGFESIRTRAQVGIVTPGIEVPMGSHTTRQIGSKTVWARWILRNIPHPHSRLGRF
jgi:hypothetical protein